MSELGNLIDSRSGSRLTAGVARPRAGRFICFLMFLVALLSCSAGGGDVAANGGMSGTGISQGSVSAFGSIFVNGVEWDVSGAAIEIDGVPSLESDLRVGMVVRVDGDFAAAGLTGTASSVRFDDAVEGPIEATPIETIPGSRKTFSVLGTNIEIDVVRTLFGGGASYANLAADDVVEVSGFVDELGVIQATRVESKGAFPGNSSVELRGVVANLVKQSDGSGIFDLGSIVVRYLASTTFDDVTRASLSSGDLVEVRGALRLSGTEVDATELELEVEGLGGGDSSRVEIEGFVVTCSQSPDFCVGAVPVDASSAIFDPASFVPMPGDAVEVEGALVAGTLRADRIESENEDPNARNVRIQAAVTSVDASARTLVILGVTVSADGETVLEDDSSVGDESFMFGEILPGDYLEIRAVETGPAAARALLIDRDDATPGADDVRFEGPVTDIDPVTPGLSILGVSIPIDGATLYFDELGTPRSEEQFFRNPGDVMLDDVVRARDSNASDLSVLAESDEVEIEGP